MPAWFDGIEFRGVRREEVKVKPVRMSVVHDGCGGVMSGEVVPDHEYLATVMPMNFMQPEKTLRRVEGVGNDRETKRAIKTFRRDGEKADSRRRAFLGSFDQRRRFTDGSPCGTAVGGK